MVNLKASFIATEGPGEANLCLEGFNPHAQPPSFTRMVY